MVSLYSEKDFTPTQWRIVRLLSDGLPHRREEIFECLWDEAGRISNIRMHLSNIRRVLHQHGETVVCEVGHGRFAVRYRHVRLLRPSPTGSEKPKG